MKKIIALILAAMMLLSSAAALAEPVTLVYAEVNPLEGTIVGSIAKFFKEKVEELSGGEIIIDIQASGVLGTEAQILDGIMMDAGTVDISRISAFALSSYGCKKATLLSLPFVFENRAHFWNFANSELAAEFLNEPQTIGLPLRGIAYGEEGFRHFFFQTGLPVAGIEDLKDLKIRVSEDPVMTGMVKALGAYPTTVSFTELYSALQSGVVVGAEQPIANYKSNAFPEVANTLLLDGHTLGAIQLVITDMGWAKLTEQQQAWILEAGKLTQEYNAQIVEAAEADVLAALKEEGCNIIEVTDKTPYMEACKPIVEANVGAEMAAYEAIINLK
ncbi:MAG: C4-dicarboxylate ABC transporter substrate-binding protein [Clostridiales bacterium]|nr:C4-dicarboxylate ABC transporter substrate-binding protein [Clostridiales bacterium]